MENIEKAAHTAGSKISVPWVNYYQFVAVSTSAEDTTNTKLTLTHHKEKDRPRDARSVEVELTVIIKKFTRGAFLYGVFYYFKGSTRINERGQLHLRRTIERMRVEVERPDRRSAVLRAKLREFHNLSPRS